MLTRFLEKARGLLGTGPDAEPVALVGCSSVHTFGMRYALDIAFVSRDGRVIRVVRRLGPRRMASCWGSHVVIERPATEGPWLCEGDSVLLSP